MSAADPAAEPNPDPTAPRTRDRKVGKVGAVVLVGFDRAALARVEAAWPTSGPSLIHLDDPEELSDIDARVIGFGDGPPPAAVARSIRRQLDGGREPSQFLVLAAGSAEHLFEDFVEDDRIFYLTRRPPAAEAVVELLAAAVAATSGPQDRPADIRSEAEARWSLAEPSPDVLRLVAELEGIRGLSEIVECSERAASELVPSLRVRCRFVDHETLTLWRPGPEGGSDPFGEGADADRDSAVAGIVGFVARTGRTVGVERLDEDPRFDPDADNAGKGGRERLLAVALPAGSGGPGAPASDQGVEAVLSLARGARQDPFHEADRRKIEHLARELGPILRRRRLVALQAWRHSQTQVFRRQALEHRERGLRVSSEPLRVVPAWLGRAYRSILVVCVLALLILPFAGSSEYAMGTAVVRLGEKVEVRARSAGILATLDVRSGDRVHAGQILGRLDSSRERAELEMLDRELEQQLVERLRRPGATVDPSGFVALRERRLVSEARLKLLTLEAPVDAIVGDWLVKAGRPITAGQPVVGLSALRAEDELAGQEAAGPRIEVLLPGRFRPLLEPGMEVRFRIAGYDDVELELEIGEVGSRVLSSEWARRLMESDLADTTPGEGRVLVRADLPAASFESEGQLFPYFDGMTGSAEIRVRKRRFIVDWWRSFRDGGSGR